MRPEQPHAADRQSDAEGGAGDREEQAFDKECSQYTERACAESQAHRGFAFARGGSAEKEARDVCAGHQQDEDGAHRQCQQDRARLVAQPGVERNDRDLRDIRTQVPGHARRIVTRVIQRHAMFQADEHVVPAGVGTQDRNRRGRFSGKPHVGGLGRHGDIPGQHADDHERSLGDVDRRANHARHVAR